MGNPQKPISDALLLHTDTVTDAAACSCVQTLAADTIYQSLIQSRTTTQ